MSVKNKLTKPISKIYPAISKIKDHPISQKLTFFQEFVEFIKKYGVLGLALGVVVGSGIKSLVDSLTTDIINPILGKILGKVELKSISIWDIHVGSFLTQLINFLILLFVVYLSIRLFLARFMSEEEKEKLNVK
jgi:large conductance mechanosensitive channel